MRVTLSLLPLLPHQEQQMRNYLHTIAVSEIAQTSEDLEQVDIELLTVPLDSAHATKLWSIRASYLENIALCTDELDRLDVEGGSGAN